MSSIQDSKLLGKKRSHPEELLIEGKQSTFQSGDKTYKIKCTIIRNPNSIKNRTNVIEPDNFSDENKISNELNGVDDDQVENAVSEDKAEISIVKGEKEKEKRIKEHVIFPTKKLESTQPTQQLKSSEPEKKNTFEVIETSMQKKEPEVANNSSLSPNPEKIKPSGISSLFPCINKETKSVEKDTMKKGESVQNPSVEEKKSPIKGISDTNKDKNVSIFSSAFGNNKVEPAHDNTSSLFNPQSKVKSLFDTANVASPSSGSIFSSSGIAAENKPSLFGNFSSSNTWSLNPFSSSGLGAGHMLFGSNTGENKSSFSQFLNKKEENNTQSFFENKESKNENKDHLFGTKTSTAGEKGEESEEDNEDEECIPDNTIQFQENTNKETNPYTKLFSKQIDKLYEYSKQQKKFTSKGKGVLSIEQAKVNEKTIIMVVYRNLVGNSVLDGQISKDLTKFKNDIENGKSVASFHLVKADDKSLKPELVFVKIPFANDVSLKELEKGFKSALSLLKK